MGECKMKNEDTVLEMPLTVKSEEELENMIKNLTVSSTRTVAEFMEELKKENEREKREKTIS